MKIQRGRKLGNGGTPSLPGFGRERVCIPSGKGQSWGIICEHDYD